MSRHLEPDAEKVRKQIKEMISETATEDNSNLKKVDCLRSDDGRVMYAGEELAKQVVTLRHYLGLGPVCLSPDYFFYKAHCVLGLGMDPLAFPCAKGTN